MSINIEVEDSVIGTDTYDIDFDSHPLYSHDFSWRSLLQETRITAIKTNSSLLVSELPRLTKDNLFMYFNNYITIYVTDDEKKEKYLANSKILCKHIESNIDQIFLEEETFRIHSIVPTIPFKDKSITDKNINEFMQVCIDYYSANEYLVVNKKLPKLPEIALKLITPLEPKNAKIDKFLLKSLSDSIPYEINKKESLNYYIRLLDHHNIPLWLLNANQIDIKGFFVDYNKSNEITNIKENIRSSNRRNIQKFNILMKLVKKFDYQIQRKVQIFFKKNTHDVRSFKTILTRTDFLSLNQWYNNQIKYDKGYKRNKCPHKRIYENMRNKQNRIENYTELKPYIKKMEKDTDWIDCNNCRYPIMCAHIKLTMDNISESKTINDLVIRLKDFMEEESDNIRCKFCGEHIFNYHTASLNIIDPDRLSEFDIDILNEIHRVFRKIFKKVSFIVNLRNFHDIKISAINTIYKPILISKHLNVADFCFAYTKYLSDIKYIKKTGLIDIFQTIIPEYKKESTNLAYKIIIRKAIKPVVKRNVLQELNDFITNSLSYKFMSLAYSYKNNKVGSMAQILGYDIRKKKQKTIFLNIPLTQNKAYDEFLTYMNKSIETHIFMPSVTVNMGTDYYAFAKSSGYKRKHLELYEIYDKNGLFHTNSNPKKIADSIILKAVAIKDGIIRFYNLFSIKCPVNKKHTFDNKLVCTKCKEKSSVIDIGTDIKYYNKFKHKIPTKEIKNIVIKRQEWTTSKVTKLPVIKNIFLNFVSSMVGVSTAVIKEIGISNGINYFNLLTYMSMITTQYNILNMTFSKKDNEEYFQLLENNKIKMDEWANTPLHFFSYNVVQKEMGLYDNFPLEARNNFNINYFCKYMFVIVDKNLDKNRLLIREFLKQIILKFINISKPGKADLLLDQFTEDEIFQEGENENNSGDKEFLNGSKFSLDETEFYPENEEDKKVLRF